MGDKRLTRPSPEGEARGDGRNVRYVDVSRVAPEVTVIGS